MSCEHDCERPEVFPLDIVNRPGLARFDYRIGTYARMRAHMLDRLVKSGPLQGWSHLGSDEPGIALLEGAAIVGDILTFYQQLYANETKLATAAWEDTVRNLLRLTGYRPAPGLAGRTQFALQVEGDAPLEVPAGFPIEAQLEGFDAPAFFETDTPATAYPALSAFHLYTPRQAAKAIATGTTALEISRVGDDPALTTRSAAAGEIAEGDRIAIFDASNPLGAFEIVTVASVEERLDRVILNLEGAVQQKHPAQVSAFRLGRAFRHYGADQQARYQVFETSPSRVRQFNNQFRRLMGQQFFGGDYFSDFAAVEYPLEAEVDDLPTGTKLIFTGRRLLPDVEDFTLVRTLESVAQRTVTWGNIAAPISVVSVDQVLGLGQPFELHDIQFLRIHETLGPEMTLRAPPEQKKGGPQDGRVSFFGTRAEAEALAGRLLLLEGGGEAPQEILVPEVQPKLAALPMRPEGDRRIWPIELGAIPVAGADGFAEIDPTVTVYGNLVAASEGETQDEAPIGSGDAREAFQTFVLPSPASRHADAARTPPWEAALEIRVAGRLWTQVDTFFGQDAEAEVYILRQTEDGGDAVQFGDGATGARLPSGRNNVTAFWRTGSGARGDLALEAEARALEKLKPLTSVAMPGPATGGADPETMDNARTAAPARMRSLGRLVGLSDYEAEALAVPGVLKAGASFGAGQNPAIEVTVLTEDESPEAVAAVAAALRYADLCRGPRRHSILTRGGRRRWVAASLLVGHDPALRGADVAAAVSDALGALPLGDAPAPDGLMALARRAFGQDLHPSQLLGAAHSIPGVIWAEMKAFQRLSGLGDDPAEVRLPPVLAQEPRLLAQPDEVLLLSAHHLTIEVQGVTSDEECPK